MKYSIPPTSQTMSMSKYILNEQHSTLPTHDPNLLQTLSFSPFMFLESLLETLI